MPEQLCKPNAQFHYGFWHKINILLIVAGGSVPQPWWQLLCRWECEPEAEVLPPILKWSGQELGVVWCGLILAHHCYDNTACNCIVV